MNTFIEQLTETERWNDSGQHGGDAGRSNPGAGLDSWSMIPRRRNAMLTSIVQAEILPRLARLRRNVGAPAANGPAASTHDDTHELVGLLLNRQASEATSFLDGMRRRGVMPGTLYLGIVTQAAQVLGEMWEQDRCDFAQVTISMGRLQQVLRGLSPHFQVEAAVRAKPETVVLAPGPGEQHTLGLLMVGEFFRREGWRVAGGPATSASDAVLIVRQGWVDVAGFSIGSLARLEGLARCIQAVRRASRNPNLFVMVGGPLFLTTPGLLARTGADGAANDAAAAVRQANGLLGMGVAAD